jgi:hypothetical protein
VSLSQIAQQIGIKEVRDIPQSKEQSDTARARFPKERQQHRFDGRNTGSRRNHQNVSL